LREWGVKGIDGDEQRFYEATVWLIDDQVIKAVLNDDPMGRRPYYKACYEPIPGYFWGYSHVRHSVGHSRGVQRGYPFTCK